MKFGISLLWLRPAQLVDVARAAESLGFESAWASDHLILPADPTSGAGGHGEVPPDLPLYDVGVQLALVAAATQRLRLGTWVYVLPARHPFVAARMVQSLDIMSGGRFDFGIGVGYIEREFRAAAVDFATRGRRCDESIEICRLLWTGERTEYHGEYYSFDPVVLAPAALSRPAPPVHVGGESQAALARAARLGDGWLGQEHTPESLQPILDRLRDAERAAGRSKPLEVTVAAGRVTGSRNVPPPDRTTFQRFADLGVDRLIVRPWRRSAQAIDAMTAFAESWF
jgi:probable F420-dependent oxidoreductase